MHDEKTIDLFKYYGMPLPTHAAHGSEEEITSRRIPLKAKSWRLEGNKLIGTTDSGDMVTYIPPNYICQGMDENNLPILQKIKL